MTVYVQSAMNQRLSRSRLSILLSTVTRNRTSVGTLRNVQRRIVPAESKIRCFARLKQLG